MADARLAHKPCGLAPAVGSLGIAVVLATMFAGCAALPPRDLTNVCSIFGERGAWYDEAKRVRDHWGMPIHVQMAIIHQESRFLDDAKPPRVRFLGLPLWRKSSAYGFAQVTDGTWDWYREATGNRWADRDDFDDAVDFIGWYGDLSHRKLGISKWDAYDQYLAYHEGHGGYARKSYVGKDWLIDAARRVAANAKRYNRQLTVCQEELDEPWYWPF